MIEITGDIKSPEDFDTLINKIRESFNAKLEGLSQEFRDLIRESQMSFSGPNSVGIRTGTLRNSLIGETDESFFHTIRVEVDPQSPARQYGDILEDTKRWLSAGVENHLPTIFDRLDTLLQQAIDEHQN